MKCSKCNAELLAPLTTCASCHEIELRISAPSNFAKPIVNAVLSWSPYDTDNSADRWTADAKLW